jgi:predicted metal-dependent phosphotriesterase family hydrolase
MSFVRTVLGDIDPADLGVTYSHEHLVIDGGRPVQLHPDFRLDSVEVAVAELQPAQALGLRAVVDAMPCDAGRNVEKLAAISRQSGIHVIAPTGLHHERYYDDRHWSRTCSVDEIAELFALDVTDGIDARDYAGPLVRRTSYRAGVVKVAGGLDGLSDVEARAFEAAAVAHVRTGVPILTHCELGTAAHEQARFLIDRGVEPGHVVLSHVDKVVDRGYQREVFATGAVAEYDQGFRWGPGAENGTLTLLGWAFEDGFGDQVVLGMDAARQGYWTRHGGAPGMAFLVGEFAVAMAARGIGPAEQARLFIANPARAYAFAAGRTTPPG